MIRLVDLNHWRPNVSLHLLQQHNIPALFLKATEATDYTDDTYLTYANQAVQLGIVFGGYHYFRIQYDPTQQANYFFNVASNTELPPVLDIEKINNLGYNRQFFAQQVKTCLDRIEVLFNRKPIIYTGYYSWIELVGNPLWANEYPLWIARYQTAIPTVNQLPKNWTNWMFWQYTDREKFGPYSIDSNYFNGSKQELLTLAGK